VLGTDELIAEKIGGAHHGNELLMVHVRKAFVADDAIIHLEERGQPILAITNSGNCVLPVEWEQECFEV
jgi:hypothetical protein